MRVQFGYNVIRTSSMLQVNTMQTSGKTKTNKRKKNDNNVKNGMNKRIIQILRQSKKKFTLDLNNY